MDKYGLIHDKLDIKILILFILQRLPSVVDGETLSELTFCDNGIGYFDYAESLAELIETGHIDEVGKGYKITEKGIRNGSIIENCLPYTVRTKAQRLLTPVATAMRRNAMIQTSHAPIDGGGCMVKLSMSDSKGEIISLRIISSGEEQAKEMEQRFRSDAEQIYSSIAQILLKSQE